MINFISSINSPLKLVSLVNLTEGLNGKVRLQGLVNHPLSSFHPKQCHQREMIVVTWVLQLREATVLSYNTFLGCFYLVSILFQRPCKVFLSLTTVLTPPLPEISTQVL